MLGGHDVILNLDKGPHTRPLPTCGSLLDVSTKGLGMLATIVGRSQYLYLYDRGTDAEPLPPPPPQRALCAWVSGCLLRLNVKEPGCTKDATDRGIE